MLTSRFKISRAMIEMGIENSKSTTAAVGWLSYPLGRASCSIFSLTGFGNPFVA